MSASPGVCVFSVDVEDWFHILATDAAPDPAQWASLPSIVERNTMRLYELFAEYGIQVTCFFLGWVAERYPALVRSAVENGHEVASHGYSHMLVYEMSDRAFYADVSKSKALLEQLSGREVIGYRAPGFSVTTDTPWFFDVLAEAGYRYDSSVFPAARQHGGLLGGQRAPHDVHTAHGVTREFPITVSKLFGRQLCFFGGGYLRLFPYSLIRAQAKQVLRESRPVVFYIHPREVDPQHPRLRMSAIRNFKSYVNLKSTEPKIRRILQDFRVTSFERYLKGVSADGLATT